MQSLAESPSNKTQSPASLDHTGPESVHLLGQQSLSDTFPSIYLDVNRCNRMLEIASGPVCLNSHSNPLSPFPSLPGVTGCWKSPLGLVAIAATLREIFAILVVCECVPQIALQCYLAAIDGGPTTEVCTGMGGGAWGGGGGRRGRRLFDAFMSCWEISFFTCVSASLTLSLQLCSRVMVVGGGGEGLFRGFLRN